MGPLTTARYNVSKKVERLVSNPGDTARMSVAIVVNGPIDDAKKEALSQAAGAAAGLDTERGDQISVVGIAFDTKAAQQEEKALAAAERQQMVSTGLRYGIAMLAMLFVFLVVRQVLRKPLPVPATLPVPIADAVLEDAPTVGDLLDEMEETPATPAMSPPEETRPPEPLPATNPTEERLRRLAADDPEFVARLLRSWLVNQGRH